MNWCLLLLFSAAAFSTPNMPNEPDTAAWGTFVGKRATEVVEQIKRENPSLKVVHAARCAASLSLTTTTTREQVPTDAMVTMDFRLDRVRVFHDKDGLVARTPKVG
ncbi:hypothetical protein CTAYLR_006795 [Chrysophaeum taylorii]|uniref:Uncharacterized protein n=1 Tax=Chrysophaeum taylorii TaxID=2483200 RepID=A0AAD7XFF0_9STRA|nr:hypothetical protein CTAYLR_006795 [Chrysophaeum taylorii]